MLGGALLVGHSPLHSTHSSESFANLILRCSGDTSNLTFRYSETQFANQSAVFKAKAVPLLLFRCPEPAGVKGKGETQVGLAIQENYCPVQTVQNLVGGYLYQAPQPVTHFIITEHINTYYWKQLSGFTWEIKFK